MGISIIGAGRLGTALGRALKQAGYQIEVVVAKHAASARRAARAISPKTLSLNSRQLDNLKPDQFERLNRSNLILIATPDDAIAAVAGQLAALLKPETPQSRRVAGRIVLHVSGAGSSDALRPLRGLGLETGSLHPLVSINDPLSGPETFRRAFFCIEGDRPAVSVARSIVRALDGRAFTIGRNLKGLYHAAAVITAGHTVALFDIALEMLGSCGLSQRRAQEVLMPLLESTVTNLSRTNTAAALTGTFARGDVTTVEKHLGSIQLIGLRDALLAYVLLGQRSLTLAGNRSGSRAEFDQIARILSEKIKISIKS